jgi:hypothetical protein
LEIVHSTTLINQNTKKTVVILNSTKVSGKILYYFKGDERMGEKNNQNNQGNGNYWENYNDNGHIEHGNHNHEHRDYGHVNERVEETDSTKKPPKER